MDGMPEPGDAGEGGDTGSDGADIKLAIIRIDFSGGTMELRSDQIDTQSVELKKSSSRISARRKTV